MDVRVVGTRQRICSMTACEEGLLALFFDEAADYVAAQVTGRNVTFTDRTQQLALYGLYKQATTGPCTTTKPGIFDLSGRAKWDAWSRLKDMPADEAKTLYVEKVQQMDPSWQPGGEPGASSGSKAPQRGGMGPVFSAFAATEEEKADACKGSADRTLHELAGQGNCQGVARLLGSGMPIDERDDVGCTALHFAADRGNLEAMELLIKAGADVNASDEDGQRPLHYAALCGNEAACKALLSHGADQNAADASGKTPKEVGPAAWTLWQ